jgi:hypothetical protein
VQQGKENSVNNAKTIRSISIGSAFKMSAVLNALVFAIFGGIGVLISLLLMAVGAGSGMDAMGAAGGVVGTIIAYVVGIVFAAVFGGIVGAIYALLYNIVAGIAGGIEIVLE